MRGTYYTTTGVLSNTRNTRRVRVFHKQVPPVARGARRDDTAGSTGTEYIYVVMDSPV